MVAHSLSFLCNAGQRLTTFLRGVRHDVHYGLSHILALECRSLLTPNKYIVRQVAFVLVNVMRNHFSM